MRDGLEAALRLIAITNHVDDGIDALVARATAAVRGGATMVQVRLKLADGRVIAEVTARLVSALTVPVLVNDRVDVALIAGAAGVHLGVDDIPVSEARCITPDGFIVGASYGSANELVGTRGADYVGIGPVCATPSKTDAGIPLGVSGFRELRVHTPLPAVAIGGIGPGCVAGLREAGASGVAAIASVMGAPDPERAARELVSAFVA